MRFAVGALVVIVGVLAVLSIMESPKPSCADGTIAVSKAAEDSFNTKWNAFEAALRSAGTATVTLTEPELTSRGVRYLSEQAMPAQDLQVHLCPGGGKGQAAMTLPLLGRDVGVVVTGHLDLSVRPATVVVDSLEMGRVPAPVTTWLANRIVGLANIRIPSEIREATTTSTSVTLKGQR